MSASRYVAVDLGAESGRVMVGTLDAGRVAIAELHRFPNVPVRTVDGLHWDVLRLYAEVLVGLGKVAQAFGDGVAGIGVDSWAVDYGLLDAGGCLLGNPYHYRDARTDGVSEEVAAVVPADVQYARTGIAPLSFNTIYQLVAQARANGRLLELASSLLMIPDLLHYWLSGVQAAEYTNASTSGMLGADGSWATDLLARLGIPSHVLLSPRQPGTVLGPLRTAVREECGLGPVPVVLPATHDTASAVFAVPAAPSADGGARHAYISSGTWSLLGLELDRPILTEEARRAGFTNEGGVGGTYRFLTNIMGLWLLQECRRAWARRGVEWSYDELTARAAAIPSPGVVLDVDDPALLHPDDMPRAIAAQLQRTGPESAARGALDDPVAVARAILEGLALAYAVQLERAEALAVTRVRWLHVVGGGSRNAPLCQLTADACSRPVVAGPIEATALGNVLVQAVGTGALRDLAEARRVALTSAECRVYEPGDDAGWAENRERLRMLRAARLTW